MKHVITLIAALLAGCASTPPVPIVKTFSARTVEVTWVRSSSPCGGATACANFGFGAGGKYSCTVWSPEPTDWSDEGALQILGHEMIHCFYGAGHD